MIDLQAAKSILLDHLDLHMGDVRIVEEKIEEHDWGWVFFYELVKTSEQPSLPYLVDRQTGNVVEVKKSGIGPAVKRLLCRRCRQINLKAARRIAIDYLAFHEAKLRIAEELTQEHEWGWVFWWEFANSSGEPRPILVDRETGHVETVSTAGLTIAISKVTQQRSDVRLRQAQAGVCVHCGGSGECYCIRKGPGNATGCVRCNGSGRCIGCRGAGKRQ